MRIAARSASFARSANRLPRIERSPAKPPNSWRKSRAAVLLDGVKHAVLTTGTPNGTDRGAALLCASAAAIRAAVALPLKAQCEPPDDFGWFERLRAAGVDALGMHLEAVEPEVRARAMPGKAKVPVSYYLAAFEAAVAVFGRGQVSNVSLGRVRRFA
jgi:radical SAM protein (TIGR04043 family)